MSTSTTAELDERYIALYALEMVMTSGYALGEMFGEIVDAKVLDFGNGFDLHPRDEGPSEDECFMTAMPQERDETVEGKVISARVDLLIAKLLRSITPAAIEEKAAYFTALAEVRLDEASQLVATGGMKLAGDD